MIRTRTAFLLSFLMPSKSSDHITDIVKSSIGGTLSTFPRISLLAEKQSISSEGRSSSPTHNIPLFIPNLTLHSLLCDSATRLGSDGAAHGASEIKRHPFFRGVVWDRLRGIRAPFEPKLQSKVDVSYFPINDIDQNDHSEEWREHSRALGEEHEAEMGLPFIGYTYKRFQNFKGL